RACKTMLKGVSVARLTLWKPPAPITSQTRASLACAGRRTDLLRQRGRHADHHRTRVIKVGRPVQIVFEAVACHRLDDHPRAVRLWRLSHAPARRPGRPYRPCRAETVEEGGEI